MWPFVDIGFSGGLVVTILLIIWSIRYFREKWQNSFNERKWKAQWEEKERKELEEAEKRIDKSKVLVSEEKFDALALETRKLAKLVNHFCYESSFIDYYHKIHPEDSTHENGDDVFLGFKYILLDDILWVYDQLGHRYVRLGKNSINFDTPEGQCLFIIDEALINIDEDAGYEYRYYQSAMGDPKSLSYKAREMHKSIFETLTNYSPEKKQEEYQICTILHDYNPKYERLYRLLMYRIAKIVAEADGAPTYEEKQWLTKNALTETTESIKLEQTISSFKPSKINFSNTNSNWYEDDDEDYSDLSATVTYSVMDAPEEECDLDNLSDRDLRRLKAADDDEEYLDSDYISEHMHSIHNKIIEAIREDLESKSGDPHDGMVEVHHPPAYWGWEKVHASHQEMSMADDFEIEYTVDIF